MKPIDDLKKLTHTAYDNVKAELDVLQAMIQFKGYADYDIISNVSWDSVGISIQHKKFNWTNFLTVTIKGEDFDFSHGSGGFKDSTVSERLKATQDMFQIVELLQCMTKAIETQRIVISKLDRELTKQREAYQLAQKENALEVATTAIEQDHTIVTDVEGLLETIKSGGTVQVYSINVSHDFTSNVQMNEVENRGDSKRVNYYFQDYKYSKKDLLSALDTRTFYTKNEPIDIAE